MRCEAGWSRMEQIEKFHARPSGEIMVDYKKKRKMIGFLAVALLFCAQAYPQQQPQQGTAQRSGSETPARVPVRPPDIISDNLDRVAASADQILEVLNKESGLMVEFKQLLAEDAGKSGQILEESDLSDAAINERLKQELRTRVLATRLLRRYGYLVAKINPDSELAAEHNLAMRERIVETQKAAERANAQPQTVINLGRGIQPPAGPLSTPGRPARAPLTAVDGMQDT